MKKIYLMLMILISTTMTGQTQQYEQKYKLLVSKLGPAGVGIETVLNNWEKVDSTDEKLLLARFDYYFNKGKSSQIVTKETRKYLGMDPVLTLKDSLDRPVYYFQEPLFDDELYGQALAAADKAVAFYPDKLDFRFLKANAYIISCLWQRKVFQGNALGYMVMKRLMMTFLPMLCRNIVIVYIQ